MNADRRIPIVLVLVSLALVVFVPAPGRAQTEPARLSDVAVTSQTDSVTVFVKTSRESKYTADLMDSPSRLVIDLQDTVYAWRKTPLTVGMDPLRQIRGSQYRKGIARVVFDLTRSIGYAIREEADGLAIVIPTAALGGAPTSAASATTTPPRPEAPEPARAPTAPPVQIAQATTQAAPAPQPGNGQRLISFDFKDADVVNLLRILAAESVRNIVIGDDVKGKMSISLRNVPWDLALDTVLETRGLRKVEKDGVLRIVSNEQLIKEREASARVEEAKLKAETDLRTKAAEAQLKEQEAIDKKRASEAAQAELRARGPLREETIRLAYADPEELAKTLQGILGIPPEGTQAQIPPPPPGGLLPTAEAPFSALYGPKQVGVPPIGPADAVLAKGITIRAHKPTNSLFIRHYEADLERIKKLIKEQLDIPLPQVKLEARMEELNRTDFFALGVRWGGAATRRSGGDILVGQGISGTVGTNPSLNVGAGPNPGTGGVGATSPGGTNTNSGLTLSNFLPVSALTGLPLGGNVVNFPITNGAFGNPAAIAFGIVSRNLNINVILDALQAENKTASLARPEVVTVENAKAAISLGSEIPYATVSSAGTQVQFKEALLKLEMTPTVIREGDITKVKLIVSVENNSRGIDVNTASGPVPSINKRTAMTQVVVRDGETLAIGGIRQRDVTESVQKVPFFGDIPIIGYLFRTKSQTTDPNREMVVFITPHVLKLEAAAQAPPAQPPKK